MMKMLTIWTQPNTATLKNSASHIENGSKDAIAFRAMIRTPGGGFRLRLWRFVELKHAATKMLTAHPANRRSAVLAFRKLTHRILIGWTWTI